MITHYPFITINYEQIIHNFYTETDKKKLEKHSEFSLNYKIGTQTEIISTAKGCALTVGRYKENDICTGYNDLTISRVQCFIFVIDDSLIVLDGWSYAGYIHSSINVQILF